MHPVVNIALRAARDAAQAIVHASDRLDRVQILDSTDGQITTSIDRDAEKTILYHLQKAYPDHSFHSRVSGYIKGADENNTWFIDPLNGSMNFLKGFGHHCVTIALRTGHRISHGVVVHALQGEEFTASRGNGAQLNTQRLRVAKRNSLAQGLVCLEAPDDGRDEGGVMVKLQQKLYHEQCNVRLTGCPALDLAYTAAGKADAGWLRETAPWSIGAAQLILQEAGGLISDHKGNPEFFDAHEMIFGSPRCFKQLLQLRGTVD